jgi:hypothetical protein
MNGFEDFAKKKTRIPVHPCCDSSPRMSTQTKREGWGKCKDYLTCTLYVSFYFIMHFISCRRTHRALSFPSLRVPLLLRSGTRGASCGTGAGNGVCVRERERERERKRRGDTRCGLGGGSTAGVIHRRHKRRWRANQQPRDATAASATPRVRLRQQQNECKTPRHRAPAYEKMIPFGIFEDDLGDEEDQRGAQSYYGRCAFLRYRDPCVFPWSLHTADGLIGGERGTVRTGAVSPAVRMGGRTLLVPFLNTYTPHHTYTHNVPVATAVADAASPPKRTYL